MRNTLTLHLLVILGRHLVCYLSNRLIPNNDLSYLLVFPEEASKSLIFNALEHTVRWDSLYFYSIIMNWYQNDKQMAFFPGYPIIIRKLVSLFDFGIIQKYELVLVISVILNAACNLATTSLLHRLIPENA